MSEKLMTIWTIYESPTDFPGKIIVRGWDIAGGGCQTKAREDHCEFKNILEARHSLRSRGYVCLGRNETDEPQIVESWI